MNYREILSRIYDGYLSIYGDFTFFNRSPDCSQAEGLVIDQPGSLFKRFPDIREMDPHETVSVLFNRLREINVAFKENMIHFADVSRLIHEMDVVSLLLIVAYWGTISPEVPITETDLDKIKAESNCEVNGFSSEEEGSRDVLLKTVETGLKSGVLPSNFELGSFLMIDSPQVPPAT